MDAYVSAAARELERWAQQCGDYTVDTVYFGGGTPSLLGAVRLYTLLEIIADHFHVAEDAEITVEGNPDSLTEDVLHALKAAGVNRLSMGIQSADSEELKCLGRIHDFSQAQEAFHAARRAGFDNISVDLMYALPGQSIDKLQRSLERILALQPEHISCYGLTLEPNTPMGRANPAQPGEEAQVNAYLTICGALSRLGYDHYEISNFAKTPQLRSRHNSRYWKQLPYLGIGPGAHSDFDGTRFYYPPDLAAFLSGSPSCVSEDEDIDRAAEYLMLGLRTLDGIDGAVYEARFQCPFAPIARALAPLKLIGYVQQEGSRWHLTEQGFLLSNVIIIAAQDAAKRQ